MSDLHGALWVFIYLLHQATKVPKIPLLLSVIIVKEYQIFVKHFSFIYGKDRVGFGFYTIAVLLLLVAVLAM